MPGPACACGRRVKRSSPRSSATRRVARMRRTRERRGVQHRRLRKRRHVLAIESNAAAGGCACRASCCSAALRGALGHAASPRASAAHAVHDGAWPRLRTQPPPVTRRTAHTRVMIRWATSSHRSRRARAHPVQIRKVHTRVIGRWESQVSASLTCAFISPSLASARARAARLLHLFFACRVA